VLIVGVAANSPAQLVGLKPGDVVVQIGTHVVIDVAAYADALLTMSPGEVVPVSICRGKERRTIKLTLGEARAPWRVSLIVRRRLPKEPVTQDNW